MLQGQSAGSFFFCQNFQWSMFKLPTIQVRDNELDIHIQVSSYTSSYKDTNTKTLNMWKQ